MTTDSTTQWRVGSHRIQIYTHLPLSMTFSSSRQC
jgi:hypothetical protein